MNNKVLNKSPVTGGSGRPLTESEAKATGTGAAQSRLGKSVVWSFGHTLKSNLRGVRLEGGAFTNLLVRDGNKIAIESAFRKSKASKKQSEGGRKITKKEHLQDQKGPKDFIYICNKKYFTCKYCNVIFKNAFKRDVHEGCMHINLENRLNSLPYYHSKKSGGCGTTHSGECVPGKCLPLPRQRFFGRSKVGVASQPQSGIQCPSNKARKTMWYDPGRAARRQTRAPAPSFPRKKGVQQVSQEVAPSERKAKRPLRKQRQQIWFTNAGFSVSGPVPSGVRVVRRTIWTKEERERRKALRRRWLARQEWSKVLRNQGQGPHPKSNRFWGLGVVDQIGPEVMDTPQESDGNVSIRKRGQREAREDWSRVCDEFIAANRCKAHGLLDHVIMGISRHVARRRNPDPPMDAEEYQDATDPVADDARAETPEVTALVESLVREGVVTQQLADQVMGRGLGIRQILSGVTSNIQSAFSAVVDLVDEVAESTRLWQAGASFSIGSLRSWLNRVRSVSSCVDRVVETSRQPVVMGFVSALCSIPFGGLRALGGILGGGALAQILTDEKRRAMVRDFIQRRTGQSLRQINVAKWLVVGAIVAAIAFHLRDMSLLEILLGSTLGLTCAVAHDDSGSKIKLAVCYHLVQRVCGRTPRKWFREFLDDSKTIGADVEIKHGIWSLAYWLMRQIGRLMQFLANKMAACGLTRCADFVDQKGRSWYQVAEQAELYGANGRISRFFQRSEVLLGPDSKLSNIKGETSVPVWAMELDSTIHEGDELTRVLGCTTSASALISCIRSRVDQLRKAKADRIEKLEGGATRVTPVVAWLAGPAGTGKTIFCSELGKRLGEIQLKLISRQRHVTTEESKVASSVYEHALCGDEVWFKSGSDKYWSRYANQVVMQWDEAGCESLACKLEKRDTETYRQFASDWLQLVASTPFKPAVATAEDKGMCVHPLYVLATSNVLGLKPLSDPQALSRRQHFPVLVYANGPKSGDFSHLKMYIPRDVHCSPSGYKVGFRQMRVHETTQHLGPVDCCEATRMSIDKVQLLEDDLGYPACLHRFEENKFFADQWREVGPRELLGMMVDLHHHYVLERERVVKSSSVWGEGDEQPIEAIERRWGRLREMLGDGRDPLRTIHIDGLQTKFVPRDMDPCIGHSRIVLTEKEKILFAECQTYSLPWAVVLSLIKQGRPFPALSLYGIPRTASLFEELWGVRVCLHTSGGSCPTGMCGLSACVLDKGNGRFVPMARVDDMVIGEAYYDCSDEPDSLGFVWEFDGMSLADELVSRTLDVVNMEGLKVESKQFDFALGTFVFACQEPLFEGSSSRVGRWTLPDEVLSCKRWDQVLALVKPKWREYAQFVYDSRIGYDYVVPFRLLYRGLNDCTIRLSAQDKVLLTTQAGPEMLKERGISQEAIEELYLGVSLDTSIGGGTVEDQVILEDASGTTVKMTWREAICARVLEPFVSKVCETLCVVQGICGGLCEGVRLAMRLSEDRRRRDLRLFLKVGAALLGVSLSTLLGFKVLESLTRAWGSSSNARVRHRKCYNCRDIDGGIWAMETVEPPRHRPSPQEVPDGSKLVAEFKPSQCGGLNTQTVSAQAMACVRDVSASVAAKVIANIGRITYHSGGLDVSMYGCNINGNVIMCPAHLVPVSERGASDFRFSLSLRGYTLDGHVVPRHDIKFPSDLASPRLRDVMLITFRDLPLGGCLKYLGDSEVKTGDQMTVLGRYNQDKQHFLVVVRGKVARTGALNYATSLEHLSYPGFVASDMALQPGDCGMLAMCGDRIVGMYVAGDNSFGARRTEFISLLRGDLEGHLCTSVAHGQILGSSRSEISAEVSEIGPVVARVHIDAFSRLPKSSLFLSGLAPGLEEYNKPQLKKPVHLVEPAMVKGLRKFHMELSQSFDCSRIIQELVGRVQNPRLRSINSWTEAASGVQDGQKISKPTDLKTSAGLPWVDMGLTKLDLYTVGPSGLITPSEAVVSAAVAYEERLREGVVDSALCFAQLKDELRTVDRVDDLKTRIFIANPCHVNLVFRKYLLPFISWYKANGASFFHAIGVNPFSREWGLIANKAVGRLVMPGDFSRFDTSHPRGVIAEAFRFISEFYDRQSDKEMVIRLGDALSNFSYYWRGGVFQAAGGQPSGSQVTTVLNSIIVSFLFMKTWEVHGFDLRDFGRRCDLVSFGDDCLLFCSEQDSKVLTPRSIVRTLASWGYEITPPSHGGEMTYVSLQDVEFLGRSFRRDHADVWFPVRNMDLVWSSLWWSSAKEDDVYIEMRLRMAIMEIAVQKDAGHQLGELRKVCARSPIWDRVLGTINCPQLIQQIRQSCGAAGGYSAVAPHPISSGKGVAEYGSPVGEPLLLTFGPSSFL